ncbi:MULTISPECIES: prepilin-type N-terminal cleavage/methylation domain-containing protein [unclassified Exiguobacterium]|uniref:prepilin-type N-terminal cleavage/methylation domain-containing protein n=1 Tax=unclassified Exiguobacterium TaxID=2644629 RepID=UPI0033353ECF
MKKDSVCRRCEQGFTMIEMTAVLLILPIFILLLAELMLLGQKLYEQPKWNHHTTPQLIVRRLINSENCRVDAGRLRGEFVKSDDEVWPWTIKQLNGNLVMVGDGGGNLLFLRGIAQYHVESIGKGFRISWTDSSFKRERYVMCMNGDSSSLSP